MNPTGDPLAQLKPLHLPPEPGWWPPAPGWWLLAVLLILLGLGIWWWYRRGAVRRQALRLLVELEQAELTTNDFAARLVLILRRYALWRFPRTQVAGLTGQAWLEFLARGANLDSDRFTPLSRAPYARQAELDRAELLDSAKRWVRRARP